MYWRRFSHMGLHVNHQPGVPTLDAGFVQYSSLDKRHRSKTSVARPLANAISPFHFFQATALVDLSKNFEGTKDISLAASSLTM